MIPQVDHLDAVILCGGLGTRLSAALPGVPKCLAPVGGRRFLEYLLLQLGSFGISKALLCVGYRGRQVEDFFESGARWGISLRYLHEQRPLGTGGALKNARPLLRSNPFLVLNGDSIFDIDLGSLLANHCSHPARATLALSSLSGDRFGGVRLDPVGNVAAFRDKETTGNREPPSDGSRRAINAGSTSSIATYWTKFLLRFPPFRSNARSFR